MARNANEPATFWGKVKENPIKTLTATLSLIITISGMVYAVINFFASQEDVKRLRNEIIDVAIMSYEDDLMEKEFAIENGASSPADRVLMGHYKRRIETLKEMKQ